MDIKIFSITLSLIFLVKDLFYAGLEEEAETTNE